MKCPDCQFENHEEVKFCDECDYELKEHEEGLFGSAFLSKLPYIKLPLGGRGGSL